MWNTCGSRRANIEAPCEWRFIHVSTGNWGFMRQKDWNKVSEILLFSNEWNGFRCNTLSLTLTLYLSHTQCVVLLQLTQTVPPCCILRTLCAASKASRDIHVVGNSADIIGECRIIWSPLPSTQCVHAINPLCHWTGRLDDCSSTLQEKGSCTYEGPASSSWWDVNSTYLLN